MDCGNDDLVVVLFKVTLESSGAVGSIDFQFMFFGPTAQQFVICEWLAIANCRGVAQRREGFFRRVSIDYQVFLAKGPAVCRRQYPEHQQIAGPLALLIHYYSNTLGVAQG